MKFRPIIALALSVALAVPGAAQTRVAVGAASVPGGVTVIPQLGGSFSSLTPSLNSAIPALALTPSLTPAPSLAAAPAAAPVALAATPVPAPPVAFAAKPPMPAAALVASSAKAVPSARAAAPAPLALRAQGEAFWSGAASKADLDDSAPVVAPAAKASASSRLLRGAGVLAPAAALPALPSLPHWVSAAAPYAEGAALLGGAYALNRAVRWAIEKAAAKRGWEKNTVAMWRFLSALAVYGGAAAVGLSMAGVTGSTLASTFGVGGTAMALAISLAVKDVAGNLFHGVHFLLTRPFTIGDKITIGKTTATVRDLTLRYIVLTDESGRDVLRTYSSIAASPVTLYGVYQTKELRLQLRKPTLPRGLLRAVRDAATPALWKPVVFSALAITALAFFPMLTGMLALKSLGWAGTLLPYAKAALVGFLTNSLSNSLTRAVGRLGERYGWNPAVVTVAKLGLSVATWIVGGSFLLNAVGISLTWILTTLSIGGALVSIAVTDYVTSVFNAIIVFRLKPFAIGDENVTIGEHTGTVVDITWQNVVLKLDDARFVILPHAVVKDAEIKTPRKYGQRSTQP